MSSKERRKEFLVHVLDPAAKAASGVNTDHTCELTIRNTLGGPFPRYGATFWEARIAPPRSPRMPTFGC